MAQNVSESLKKTLASIINEGDSPLETIDVVPSEHVEQIRNWNADIPPRVETRIQDRFEENSRLRPDALAIQGWDGDLTYRELNGLANKLAAHLVSLGVAPEIKVPLCFEKSKWAVVAQLAIMKASGCVVPISTNQPKQRTDLILKDIEATVLLTTEFLAGRFEGMVPHVVIVNENTLSRLEDSDGPVCEATPDNTAFIIYTSGSTGVPKGVVLPHGSLSTSLHYLGAKFQVGVNTSMVQFSAYTFDISIQDIYTTLQRGGCLVIISEEDRLNNLGATMRAYGVTCAGLTSTVAGTISPEEIPSLQTLVLLGEAVKPVVVNKWVHHVAVYNAYGPSECSIQASVRKLTPTCNALNIGYAFAGALWVVDASDFNRLVPIGAPGELLIEGPLQAKGYLNNKAKTDEAFVTNPTWALKYGFGPDRRFYRTGDLVQQGSDGSTTYIGRRDTQVKFRGQRVEIGEIEHHLIEHEATDDAAIVLPSEGLCKERLVAVITLHDHLSEDAPRSELVPLSPAEFQAAKRDIANLEKHLATQVLEHMVPTVWIPLSNPLPQNESAKLDRKRLKLWVEAMDRDLFDVLTSSGGEGQGDTRPSTLFESQIQGAYADVLNLPRSQIPIEGKSFLGLGGDSIGAMQVISRVREHGMTLVVRDILQSKSISELAKKSGGTDEAIVNGDAEATDTSFPLSPIQQWYLKTTHTESGRNDARHSQSICLEPKILLSEDELAAAFEAIVARHPMLRARFRLDDGNGWRQRIVDKVEGSYHFGTSSTASRDDADTLMAGVRGSLDPVEGPVFAARLVQYQAQGQERQFLLLAAHRLVIDAASWKVIVGDLCHLLRGQTLSSERGVSYFTWVKSTKEVANSRAHAETPIDLDYWGLPSTFDVSGDTSFERVILDEDATSLLLDHANRTLRTEPVEVILAALSHTFSVVFPDRSVPTILTEMDGWKAHVPDTIGWFASISETSVYVSDGEDAVDVLKQTKGARRRALQINLSNGSSHYPAEILLSFHGQPTHLELDQQLFTAESQAMELVPSDSNTECPAVFHIDATFVGSTLQTVFRYKSSMRHVEKIQTWAHAYSSSVAELVATLTTLPPQLTASDFDLLEMTDSSLSTLHEKVLPELGIQPDEIEDIYPCSPIQQGILMSQAKSPSEYQIQQIFKVECPHSKGVSVEGIIKAWQSVVDRHPMLRTIFMPSVSGEDGMFHQLVLKAVEARAEHLRYEDEGIEGYLKVETCPELGVHSRQPSHKLAMYSTPSGRVYGRLILSHALVDASSLALIQKELIRAYDGKLDFETTGPSYSAYISYLQQSPAEESLQYWGKRLANTEPCHLPALTETGMLPEKAGDIPERQPMEMEIAELNDIGDLHKFSESQGVTVANIFQLAWALVLSKYTGSEDVSFGYLANGRDVDVESVNSMIGPLINIMVTRVNLTPDIPIEKALQTVQDDFLDGFNHQRTSLSDILHALNLKGRSLFNTSLSYRHAAPENQEDAGLSLDLIAGEDPTEYDATVSIISSGNKMSVWLQYSPEFMCQKAAAGLVGCLLQAVKSFVKTPQGILKDVQTVTKEDLLQLQLWNDEVPKQDADKLIHEIFSAQRVIRPEATAVCAWDGELSYQELEDAGDGLACHLVDLGVGVKSKVALCLDKSKWAVIAQLAILKAGGVVVSINPQHPLQRLKVILRDIDATVMLTTSNHSSRFTNLVTHIIELDTNTLPVPKPAVQIPNPDVKPDNAAFIIYTSGSTGKPKGVVLTHYSLISSFKAHGQVYGMSPTTRSIQFASYTFDASISDIWGTICHGGCVCVISEEERMNGLEEAIRSYEGTLCELTPTVASLLDLSKLSSLQTLVLGGEAVKPSMIEDFVTAPNVSVLNGYGPSECSIYTTCGKPLRDVRQAPIIGRPLVGAVWVVDEHDSICPIGSIGELWIGGPLLAQGYLNDQEKTDKSFVKDPLWAQRIGLPSQRFYRTGDLVRQSRTGDVIYVSRKDSQVKIRGQRVEVGEIEYRVKKCLPSAKGVVASLITVSGNTVVAAAIELGDDYEPNSANDPSETMFLEISKTLGRELCELRTALSDALPSYMIPSLYIPVSRFPMTTSGKVDRRSLAQMLQNLSADNISHYSLSKGEKVAPVTETEKALQSLWAAVLKVAPETIGIHDHFLHLGGDSFVAMRLVGMATSSGLSLSVSDVFRHPKLADMASAIDQRAAPEQGDGVVPRFSLWEEAKEIDGPATGNSLLETELRKVSSECSVEVGAIEDVYPCTPLQEGLMAITAQKPSAYIGRWAFRIPEETDIARFKHAWEKLVVLSPILRTRILPGTKSALQVVVREQVTWLSGNDLEQYLAQDAATPMAYGSPLARLAIVQSTECDRHFVLTAHHSLYDGWSFTKMFETAARIYASENIPPPPTYTRLIKYLQGQDSNAAVSFWRAQLGGEDVGEAFPALPSPNYEPRPSQTVTQKFDIGELSGNITAGVMLRAAWALAISPHTTNPIFAMPLSGRGAPVQGILDIIGPTITTVPLRVPIDKEQGAREYLNMVHQQSLDMMPFEHTGLQNIRRLVGQDVDLRHLFAVQSAKERETHMAEKHMGLELVEAPMEGFDSYALTVECTTDGSSVEVEARFDEHVLSTLRTRNLLDRFSHVLAQLVKVHNGGKGADKPLRDIKTVSPYEIAQLSKWNQDVPGTQQVLIHNLVSQHCATHPEAPAVCSWDGALSHGELDLHSTALSAQLSNLGVGPEVKVPICLDKSKWAPVAMLAVLKVGGVLVPVRPDPVQRLDAILKDTAADIALVTPRYISLFEDKVSHVLAVDDALFANKTPNTELPQLVRPSNAAFIIYTSGSTGTPKGVVLEHQSMATSLLTQVQMFGLDRETRAFQFSHFTFDASVHDIFTTLFAGGCVCLPSEEERMNDIPGAIKRMNVNYAFLTPAVLGTLRPGDVPQVRTVGVGGEAVRSEHVGEWLGKVRIINAYGPAECSIMVTAGDIIADTHASRIGKNLAASLWVVDEDDHNRLLPAGVTGELLIEGPVLARGYLNDAEKTSSAFIESPTWLAQYGLNPEGLMRRMYRTGDRVVQNDDGSFLYVGRKDGQVKIRGQRVEVGEVEHHLTQHSAVADGVVLYPRDGPSKARLVGILSLHDFKSGSATAGLEPLVPDDAPEAFSQVLSARDQLTDRVPGYMVPSVWITLSSLPQNDSGKIDRKKLTLWLESMNDAHFKRITQSKKSINGASQKPTTHLESQLQSVISEILHLPIDQISLGRSFLSMGGDSITAMQVVSQCRRHGISLLVRDILQSKSISQLALKASTDIQEWEELEITGGEFELSPIQQLYFESLASHGLNSREEDRFNQSVCLSAQSQISAQQVVYALEVLVTRHPMLRARFHDTNEGMRQRIEEDVKNSFRLGIHQVDDLSSAEDIVAHAQRTLDLENGPVFSADWIEVPSVSKKLLFLTAHHLVVDLVSWRIIVRDLEALIRDPTSVAGKSLSFQGWTQLQARHIRETSSAATELLPSQGEIADWSYWGIRPETNTYGDRTSEHFSLSQYETSRLFSDANPLRTEPLEILIAALIHSYQRAFPSRPSPTVFNESHGRQAWSDNIDLSETVGWFTTLSPIHVPFEAEDLVDVLCRTKDVRRAMPGRGMDYFASRFFTPAGKEAFASHDTAEIAFNYTGRFQQLENESNLLRVDDSFNSPRLSSLGANIRRLALFEIEASVQSDGLRIDVNFSKKMQRQDAVKNWALEYASSLRELLSTLSSLQRTFTLSDFPSMDLTYEELSRLQNELLPEAGVAVVDVQDIYPCSPIQQGILLSQIKDQGAYQAQQVCELQPLRSTTVDLTRLSSAWEQVVSRHPILRTIFIQSVSAQSPFHQVVLREKQVHVPRIHCETPSDVTSTFAQMGRPEYADNQSANQLAACTTAEGRTYVRLNFNHALMDASSLAIIFRDLVQAYDGTLPEAPAPSYGLHVSYLQQTPASESLAYWIDRLEGAQPCHLLPSTTPTSTTRSLQRVESEIMDLRQLHAFRNTHGLTMANIVQFAWGLVLSRYTSSSDVLFGYLSNGRDTPIDGVNEIAGPMINMTVSRICIPGDSTPMAKIADKVQEEFMQAMNNQRTPLGDIQHALKVSERGLFNTTLSYTREPNETFPPDAGLRVHGVSGEDPTEYDVNVTVLAAENSMKLFVQYSTSFLDEESAKCLSLSLQHALHCITRDGSATLSELERISPSDVDKLRLWNDKVPNVIEGRVADKILAQRLTQPDAPAICAWDGELSYAELDHRAEQLARHLTNLGVVEESMVGVYFEKSMWSIVAMFGVLKAGGVVVPLGFQLPIDRLHLILEDTAASVVLTSAKGAEKLRSIPVNVLTLDSSSPIFATTTDFKPCAPVPVNPSSAAVIIYTSGSTGRPKGVVLTHSSLHTSLEAHGSMLQFSPNTRALQFASYVFDISLLDTLGVLQFGGCVCVVSEEDRLDIQGLAAAVDAMDVNFACLTPTVAALLDPVVVPTLRTLTLAGEKVSSSVVETWLPHATVYNGYGPAECTVLSSINGPITNADHASNIGCPIAGTAWVTEPDDGYLVPIGAVGELLLEGPILARGYLNDSHKTATSFITDPDFLSTHNFGSAGRRMYRTGDLVRQSPIDGSLMYIGRRDGQVKIRGQRVEVGEIEHRVKEALPLAHMAAVELVTPSVRGGKDSVLAVAVELREHGTGASEDSTPLLPLTPSMRQSFVDLQNTLSDSLPSFMVPSLYVPLTKIPLTASGKLDRLSLRSLLESLDEEELAQYGLSVNSNEEQHLTEMETCLRDIWAGALNTTKDRLGSSSHFFRVGGDSVTAMRLVSLARSATPEMALSVADVFKNPVLSDMAGLIASKSDSPAVNRGVTMLPFSLLPEGIPSHDVIATLASQCGDLSPDDIEDAYPCTPLQEGLLSTTTRRQDAYVNRWVFRMDDTIDATKLEHAWRSVYDIVPIMRTRIVNDAALGPTNVRTKEPMSFLNVSSSLESYLATDSSEPMGFGTRLMRFAIVIGPSGSFFVWTAHHSVYDGWSVAKLLDAVSKAYSGTSVSKFTPFSHFIQHVQANNSTLGAEEYWATQLHGHTATPFPELPQQDTPTVYHSLTRDITLSAEPDTFTLATLLRAAWALVLSKQTSVADISFPTPLSGRTSAMDGILDVVGPTITTVPVRVQVDRTQSIVEYLSMIQQQSIDMIPFEHTGLQNIHRAVPSASIDSNHLFVIQPSTENMDGGDEVIPGLTFVPHEVPEVYEYPLVLTCNTITSGDTDRGVELRARFNKGVLPVDKMQNVLEQFDNILSQLQLPTASSGRVGDLDLMSPADMRQLRAWNPTPPPPRFEATMHGLIHQVAIKKPDTPAVSAFDGELTYSQLDALATRLANHLCGLGVRLETAVGLMFEKTVWTIVTKLAILKAGGVVVPLNHKHPKHRLQGIVGVTGAKLLLTSTDFDVCQGLGCDVITVNQRLLDSLPDNGNPACSSVHASNAAFILFTSGSTGTPKGVTLEHGSITRNFLELGSRCGTNSSTRILQFSAYTFDLGIAEIFATLLLGGCVCVISEEDRMGDLAGAIVAAGVNTTWLTPTVAGLLSPAEVPAVHTILFAGEALKREVLEKWISSGVSLFNGYGPTEGTVVTSLNGPITDINDEANIGRVVGGSNLWVVDPTDHHRLVPVGSVGELLIDGTVLSRGYVKDPAKTAEVFVEAPSWLSQLHPTASSPKGRGFYRTGDLVRQMPDGALQYIGRRDTQIKIHGQRIEIGEIEYWVKNKLADVREAAVGMVTTSKGAVLAAAVETGTAEDTNSESGELLLSMSDSQRREFCELQKVLGGILPTYMVPQIYLPVAKLPLSQSGKLDRKAVWDTLQQIPTLSSYLLVDDIKVPPSTDTERRIQDLWATALNLTPAEVGANDDFFSLGGDSIAAMRMVAKAHRSGGTLRSLTVALLFRHRVLSEVAAVIDEQILNGDSSTQDTYRPFSALGDINTQSFREGITPLLASPGRIVDAAPTTDFQALSVIGSLRNSRDMLAHVSFDGTGPCGIERWRESCLQLIQSHEILRTAYVLHEERLLQVILGEYRPDVVQYEVSDDQTVDEFTKELIAKDMHNIPCLGRPFTEFAIVTSSRSSRHRILFRLSHGEYDAIALSYFIDTLKSIHAGQPVPEYHGFPSYVGSLVSQDKTDSVSYWQKTLKGSSMPEVRTQRLDTQDNVPPLVHFASATVNASRDLPPGLTASTVIRAAWAQVLAHHTGSSDVVFGEVVSGRNTGGPIAERAAGCCANVVPVRVPFGNFWTAADLLDYVREQQISRLPHETLGFREVLGECAGMSPSQHFTSRINHLDAQPGLTLVMDGVSYDVSVSLSEGASDFSDVSITSIADSEAGSIRLSLGYLDGCILPQEAAALLEELRKHVDLLINGCHSTALGTLPVETVSA